jgi:hypothetical protein
MRGLAAVAIAVVGVAGCKSENTVDLQTQVDVFAQAPNNKVDILWVVDDSNSMAEEQQALADGFASFASTLESSGTDFQLGVITTSFEYTNPERGKLIGDPPFVTNADDYETAFVERATGVGTGGSDKEKGLEAALWAVSPLNVAPGGLNEGFVRSDAQLLVVIVSDEEDCSDGGALEGQESNACYSERDSLTPVTDFVRDFRDLKPDDGLVSVGVIVGPQNPSCPEVIHGERYLQWATLLGGLRGDICLSDWGNTLGALGLNAAGVREAFQLSRAADPESLVVSVDDAEVAQDPTDGWTYDVPSWTITFHGAGVPPRGSTVSVSYTVDPSRVSPEGTAP